MGTVGAKIWGVVNSPALGAGLGVANLIVGGVTCGKVCSFDTKLDSLTSDFSKTSKVVIDNSKDAYEMSCVAKDTVTKMNSAVNDISGYFKEMKELDAQNPPQQQISIQPQQMQQIPMQMQQAQANWANLTQKQIFEEGKAAALAELEAQKEAESKDKKIEALEKEIANLKNGGTSSDEKIPAWLNSILEKNPDKAVDLINAFVGGNQSQNPQQPEVDPMLAAKAAEYDRLMAMQKEAEERQKEAEAQEKMQSFADKIQAKFDSYDEALSNLGTAVGNLNTLLTSMQTANDANKGSNKKNG